MDHEGDEGLNDLLRADLDDMIPTPQVHEIDYEEAEITDESLENVRINTSKDIEVISEDDGDDELHREQQPGEEPLKCASTDVSRNVTMVSDNGEDTEGGLEDQETREEPLKDASTSILRNVTMVSDNDEDDEEISQPNGGGTTTYTPNMQKRMFNHTRKMARLTPAEQRAKAERYQKLVIERACGKKANVGAGSFFKGLHDEAAGTSLANDRPNEHAWMEEISSESDDGIARLRAAKKEYKKKAKNGSVSMETEIALLKAEKEASMRLRRLEKAKAREDENTGTGVEFEEPGTQAEREEQQDPSLFLPEDAPGSSLGEQSHFATVHSEGDNGDYRANMGSRSEGGKHSRHRPVKSTGRDPMTGKLAKETFELAIDAEMEEDRKRELVKEKRAKGKSGKPNGKEKAKKSRTRKSGHKGTGLNSRIRPELTNLASLLSHDVIADAQANEGYADQPTFTETRKAEALKELISSVPEGSRKRAILDKNAILKATRSFNGHGRGTMRADGDGRWKLKGMVSSLYNYQLVGAAFMRDREEKGERPHGGLCADEMGLGKTVMMIANIIDGRPLDSDPVKTTLIVATPGLLSQWMAQIKTHSEPGAMGTVIMYHAGSRFDSDDIVGTLKKFNVILTTYSEVSSSWPKTYPPDDCKGEERKIWIQEHIKEHKGPLHRICFHRIVLDEATAIKNHLSHTSRACLSLTTKHPWAMSGTPIQNRLEEFYPYFHFLKVKHTGNFETFRENFCDESDVAIERLDAFLGMIMIRRTHKDKMFSRPILKLPPSSQQTTTVYFDDLERSVYDIVERRFRERINWFSKKGILKKQYRHVFVMLLRLRQLTGHIFMIQQTIEDLLEKEDVEKLLQLTETAVSKHSQHNNTLVQLRRLLAASKDRADVAAVPSFSHSSDTINTGKHFGNTPVNFKKYLDQLQNTDQWAELDERSICPSCHDPVETPFLTSCHHVYCQECLQNLQYTAAKKGEDGARCLECGRIFNGASPCDDLGEIGAQLLSQSEDSSLSKTNETIPGLKKGKEIRKENNPMRWIDMGGNILPSAKTLAIKAQVLNWIQDFPNDKIIIFAQFLDMLTILGSIFKQEGWGYCKYNGKMSLPTRDETIESFAKDKKTIIMLASLRSGGVGLNLTMASRVMIVDPWWNSSVDQQAFCRVFRLGQLRETCLRRFVVSNTIDERIIELQKSKDKKINRAMGDDGKARNHLTVSELIRLFGPVKEGEDGKEFILVDEPDENDIEMSGVL